MPLSATEILSQIRRPNTWPDTTATFSGLRWRTYNPRVEDVRLEDIAYGLAHKYRFGGHAKPGVLVASHSITVRDICHILWPEFEAEGLMHDSCEAYGHDIPTPVKSRVFVQGNEGLFAQLRHYGKEPAPPLVSWVDLEHVTNGVVFDALGLDWRNLDTPEVHAADILACTLEKRDSGNLTGEWGLPPIPEEIAHLRVVPETPEEAYTRFMRECARYNLACTSTNSSKT